MKVRDVIKAIEKDGWVLDRTRGDHRQYVHPGKPGTVTVPGHPGDDMPAGR
ncbi:MAG: type II toxin-antitoxin system HicA family toxin [Candidatus Solibacter sp.]